MLKFKPVILSVILLSILTIFVGCGDESQGSASSKAWLAAGTVNCNATTNSIQTQGDRNLTCTATILTQGDTEWCSFDLASSVLETTVAVGKPIYIYMKKNTAASDREATLRVLFSDGYTADFTMTQTSFSVSADYDRAWGEQPLYRAEADYVYKTYFTTLSNGKRVRNYSICYDLDRHVSNWVAYPQHASYWTGRSYEVGGTTQGRTNAWAYDDTQTEYTSSSPYYRVVSRNVTQPAIAEQDQQYIIRSYGQGGYQRGHMLSSASRYNTWETNAQTFYATNMMPQNGSFNGGSWGNLENSERTWAGTGRYDTLYVVTGASFKSSKSISNANGPIAVPSHCWKVMVQARKEFRDKPISECTADELRAIGFIYPNDASAYGMTLGDAACSVREVEEFTGFEFFHNLSADGAAVKERLVLSDWGISN